jgi:hypothetical protein
MAGVVSATRTRQSQALRRLLRRVGPLHRPADMILSDVRRLRVAEIGGAASLVQDTLNRASATDDRHDRPR